MDFVTLFMYLLCEGSDQKRRFWEMQRWTLEKDRRHFLKAHVTDGGNLEKENISIVGKKDVCHIK